VEAPVLTIVIVSFNTQDFLRRCIRAVELQSATVSSEVIVVDNDSKDGSAEMVEAEFPDVHLLRAGRNLGFAAANNRAFSSARGRYLVALNSDAFIGADALSRAVAHMDDNPRAGLAGGRLIGLDASWQFSAGMFPSPLNKFLIMSGLAARNSKSRFFGRSIRSWADPLQPASVDWVPGAFMIARREVLEKVGYFDERFFLYFEEIDLCRRVHAAGYEVWYWPDVVVTHVGGASAKQSSMEVSEVGTQVLLWRMRSELLYYRKHHGALGAWSAMTMETWWHRLRALRRTTSREGGQPDEAAAESRMIVTRMRQAWHETRGGQLSPPGPW
jgi:GT2 family glycosyltransferase